jgi:hypothetical protein
LKKKKQRVKMNTVLEAVAVGFDDSHEVTICVPVVQEEREPCRLTYPAFVK